MSTAAQSRLEPVNENDRLGIAPQVQVGSPRDTALQAMSSYVGEQAQCRSRPIALHNSRRAWLLETCHWSPAGLTFGQADVERLQLFFLDEELVQLQIDLPADLSQTGVEAVMSLLQQQWGTSQQRLEEGSAAAVHVWATPRDRAWLYMASARGGMTLRVIDDSLAQEPAFASES